VKTKALLAGLVLLALIQVALIGRRTLGADAGGQWLVAGDDVGGVSGLDSLGIDRPLAPGQPTLLLVFHSECGHCRRVAPAWTEWLRTHTESTRVVAVSREATAPAMEFVRTHSWGVDIRTVDASELGGAAHALTARTPWVFVIDADGRVIAEGHGDRLVELGALVAEPRGTTTEGAGS
jgi:thiol-disulfide isomerase/thioredoxin